MATSDMPPSVRILRAAAAYLRQRRRLALVILALVAIGGWLGAGVYTVGNGAAAVVRRFGRLAHGGVEPGLHLAMPPGIDAVTSVKTGQVQRITVAGDEGRPLSLVTGDENLIDTILVVQYRVSSPGSYLFRAEDPAALLARAVQAALVDEVAHRTVEDVLTSGKAAVQNEVRRKAQEMLQRYGAGLSLVAVAFQTITPPAEAAPAFLAVSDARAQAARAVNLAQSRRETSLNLEHGRAERLVDEARTWADQRVQKARGAASRFEQVLAQARRVPEQTHTDFYLAMVRKVLPKARIVVLAPGETPRLDIYLTPPPHVAAPPAGAGLPAEGVPPASPDGS